MVTLKDVEESPVKRIKKTVLLQAANLLCISRFANQTKQRIQMMIQEVEISNNRDPVTLESIRTLDMDLLVGWKQANRIFVARIDSMHHILNSENTINPFAIDLASGIESSLDHDGYVKKYDLKSVIGLSELVTNLYSKLEPGSPNKTETIPYKTRIKFDILNIVPDMYICHVVDYLETCSTQQAIRLLDTSMFNLLLHYRTSLVREVEVSDDVIVKIGILNQLYIGLRCNDDDELTGLEIAHQTLMLWSALLDQVVMNLLFDFMDKILS